MIERNIEQIIKDTISHFPIVLVTGPRQIGKSTLLYNSFLSKGYSYISLDDSLVLAMAKNDPRTFLEINKAPLIIDEAQKAPELFPELERIVNLYGKPIINTKEDFVNFLRYLMNFYFNYFIILSICIRFKHLILSL